MKNLDMKTFKTFDYDTSEYPFKETVENMMDVQQLDMIHEVFEFPEKLEIIKDQNTILHDKFYEEMKKPNFTKLYNKFVKNYVSNLDMFKDEEIIFQTYPSFRIHQPNNIAELVMVTHPAVVNNLNTAITQNPTLEKNCLKKLKLPKHMEQKLDNGQHEKPSY